MIQAIQLILALSFLVLIHELGHFTFARIFRVRVEKFYLFFNPWLSLFRAKKFDGKWHVQFFATKEDEEWTKHPETTEWGIGWLPFGGYCAIAGMVDETHKTEDLQAEPQDWEFRSKPAWQRLLIIMGGILVNFVGALVIFSMLLFHYGEYKLPLNNIHTGLYYDQVLVDQGFQQQDKILTIDGVEPEEMGDVVQMLIVEGKRNVVVLRGQDTISLTMTADLGNQFLARKNDFDRQEREKARANDKYVKQEFISIAPFMPCVVDTVLPEYPAYAAGIQKGDSIVMVGGVYAGIYPRMVQELRNHPSDSVDITYYRAGELMTARVLLSDSCMLGIQILQYEFPTKHITYKFFEAIPAGIRHGWEVLEMYVKQFRLVFSKEGAQSLGGFGAIGGMFPDGWNWGLFWTMTAVLSIILAFMNFLPIPALDGGYILFLLWEMITRRKPSDKFLETANQIGFWLLLALLIYANGNDILKIFY